MKDITVKGLKKKFGDKTVFDGLDISFKAGKVNVLMGESGRGKTLLTKILTGLIPADAGNVDGVPDKISVVFQEDRLCESFSVYANIAMVNEKLKEEEIINILKRLDLDGEEKTKVMKLSGGMKRRVAIARALMAESDLLILDEPFSGLDEYRTKKAAETILDYSKGKTIIFITHDENHVRIMQGEVQRI